jgi:hypothetical protein
MHTIENLLREGITLKREIEARQQKLREINKSIAECAEYKPGSSTGHVAAGGIMAKVTKRQNVKWDQDALAVAHKKMGTALFAKAFTYKFEPINARQLKNWLASGGVPDEAKHLILEARTVTEGAPSVVYEEAGDAD